MGRLSFDNGIWSFKRGKAKTELQGSRKRQNPKNTRTGSQRYFTITCRVAVPNASKKNLTVLVSSFQPHRKYSCPCHPTATQPLAPLTAGLFSSERSRCLDCSTSS